MLLSLYRKTKKNIVVMLVSIVMMILSAYIFSDLTEIAGTDSQYLLLISKWLVLLMFLSLTMFHFMKIMKHLSTPFKREEEMQADNSKREKILSKAALTSRSDLIVNKYKRKV
jgi:hypothetical protein